MAGVKLLAFLLDPDRQRREALIGATPAAMHTRSSRRSAAKRRPGVTPITPAVTQRSRYSDEHR